MDAYSVGVSIFFFNRIRTSFYFKKILYYLGEGEDGKLGHGNRITLDKPKLIEALRSKRIRDIACGSSHSAAITTAGELFCWGLGEVRILNFFKNLSF